MSIITVHGYFINIDKFNRIKLMFLDDYSCIESNKDPVYKYPINTDDKSMSFTKSYIINKCKLPCKNPVVDDNCFLINMGKIKYYDANNEDISEYSIDNNKEMKINTRNSSEVMQWEPIINLKNHIVSCKVKINKYNFTKDNINNQGWNLKLISISKKKK